MTRRDVYAEVTNSILSTLESGDAPPWVRSWTTGRASDVPLRWNGAPYRGVNTLLLWLKGAARGYRSPYWMTLHRANDLGGRVIKGEHSTEIVFSRTFIKDEGTDDERKVPVLRFYRVFNTEQITGLPSQYTVTPEIPDGFMLERDTPAQDIDIGDMQLRSGVKLRVHSTEYPRYIPSIDTVCMPYRGQFKSWYHYASTFLHEMVHWTGHSTRLNRDLSGRFSENAYGMEELIAEVGAGFACGRLGIYSFVREDNASYIQGWIKTLREDNRAIFAVTSRAQAACDYLMQFVSYAPDKLDEVDDEAVGEGE